MHDYIIQLSPRPIGLHDFISAENFEHDDIKDFAEYVSDTNESGRAAALGELERLVARIGHVNRADSFIQFSLANVIADFAEWTRMITSGSDGISPRQLSEALKHYEGSRLMFWYLGAFIPSAFLLEDISRSYMPTALYIGGILDYKA